MDRFIATEAASIKNSTLPLPKTKPPPFLDEQIRPPKFSALYTTTYIGSNADYILSSFFAAHLVMEFASSRNKYFAVKMLEELLVNCSAKELKGVDDPEVYENIKNRMLEKFQREFSMSIQERNAFDESQNNTR